MEKLTNSFRIFEWKIRRIFRLKQYTIAPVIWRPSLFGSAHQPTPQFESSLSDMEKKKLERILKEVELFSRLTYKFPLRIGDRDWKSILDCQTRKQRLDHLIFMSTREALRESEKKKKILKKEANEDRVKENEDGEKSQLLLKPTKSQKIYEWLNVVNSFRLGAPTLVVDCQFLPFLSPRGRQLTGSQLQYINSENRELANPFILYFANFDSENELMKRLQKDKLEMIDSKNGLLPIVTDQCFTKHFDREKIAYLSPNGEEVLETVDVDKVYVIGGIVDRVHEPGISRTASKDAAEKAGVKCYRLPIDEYIDFKSGSKFLTLIAVMHILNDVYCHGNWQKALEARIPKRNVRRSDEKNLAATEHHKRVREFNSQVLKMVERRIGKDEDRL